MAPEIGIFALQPKLHRARQLFTSRCTHATGRSFMLEAAAISSKRRRQLLQLSGPASRADIEVTGSGLVEILDCHGRKLGGEEQERARN